MRREFHFGFAFGVAVVALLALPVSSFAVQDGKDKDDSDAKKREVTQPAGQGEDDKIKKLMAEIGDNMRRIEELLQNKDTSAATTSKQSETIDLLEKLIDEANKSSGSSSGSGRPQMSPKQQQQDQKQGDKQKQLSEQQKQAQKQKQPKDDKGQTRHDQESEAPLPQEKPGELKEHNGQGRWGRLPKTVIESMYDGGKRKLPAKYRVLLEEYFRRLPTKD